MRDLDTLLRAAMHRQASDLHLAVGAVPTVRIDAKLESLDPPALAPAETRAMLEQVAPGNALARLDAVGQVDFSYSLSGEGRFRVNAFRQRGTIGLALRVIPSCVPAWESLDLPAALGELVQRQSGLVCVSGPTGSGRSTTLAAMVDRINRERAAHVITLEDPIEYLHQHKRSLVNQREIGTDAESFAAGLRAALRQDPDVVLVSELRDPETIAAALVVAEAGHLVLAAVGASDTVSALDRMVEGFPAGQQGQVRLQLGEVLQGAVAQDLLPRHGGAGRAAAFEVLVATPAVRNLIRESKMREISSLIQAGSRYGMLSMEASLQSLLVAGAITQEDYSRHAAVRRTPGGRRQAAAANTAAGATPKTPGGFFDTEG